MLVEQARVEMEDPVADDMESEVPGLDHTRVDRPDSNLVRIMAADRHRPVLNYGVVVDERSHWLVPGEVDPVQVMGFAFAPAGCRCDVDDGRGLQADRLRSLEPG